MTASRKVFRNDDPPDWGPEYCEVCGHGADDCRCPECPECGVQGDPRCWLEHNLGNLTGRQPNHDGMRMALNRVGELEQMVDDLQEIADSLQAQLNGVRKGRDRLIEISDDLEVWKLK